jgi:hypothetical protein
MQDQLVKEAAVALARQLAENQNMLKGASVIQSN